MKVIDNALHPITFRSLQEKVLSKYFPWYYGRRAIEDSADFEYYRTAFQHNVYNEEKWNSDNNEFFALILNSCLYEADEKIKTLLRMRIVLNYATETSQIFGQHIDFKIPHTTMLLYINDSDGDTLIYNECYRHENEAVCFNELREDLTIKEAVTPVANRLVIFDGLHYHTGMTPSKTDRRIVLNINFIRQD